MKKGEKGAIDVSVAVPTYNEAHSIRELIKRLTESFKGKGGLEIIVIDDNSPDGTAELARSMTNECRLKVLVRKNKRGLASAVADGFKHAEGRYLAVIDGDLQHPPETIIRLYEQAESRGADIAIASRKVAGGGTLNWEFHRLLISITATWIAKCLLPATLFRIRDVTTGCFLFRRERVDIASLSPIGFKIFLEVLARGKFNKPMEVPYIFNQRSLGKSKMDFRQNILFLIHLISLGLSTGEIAIPITAVVIVLLFLFIVF